jgi:hypothetical protein
MAQIFLCHASEDRAQVEEIYQRLREEGFRPWMDKEDLLPGQRWQQEIPNALRASDFILIFFSRNSVLKQGYVQREFKLALDTLQEMPESMIHTIPVRLDDCTIPEQFAFLHWCNLFEENGFGKIVQAIRVGLSQRQPSEPETLPEEPAEPRITPPTESQHVSTPPEEEPSVLETAPDVVEAQAPRARRTSSTPRRPKTTTKRRPRKDASIEPTLTNSIGMEFILIPAGEFLMGSTPEEIDRLVQRYGDSWREYFEREIPQHQVRISEPFYLGKYQVTQGEWQAVMGENPSRFTGDANRPVENVSWDDVQKFIRKLNERG